MDDVITEPTPEPAPAPAPEPAPAPIYYGPDGALSEGWQSTLPEGYRDEPSLKTVKDAKILAKMFVDTKRMVGKNTIAIPDENSPKDEWSEYYRHGGRPDSADDYGLAVPEGFPPELAEQVFPADRIAKWQQRFYEGGVSKKAANQFIAEFANDMLADAKNMQMAEETAMANLAKGLSVDWGAAYDQKIHLGNIAIEEGTMGSVDFKERVVAKVQKDPDLTRLLANLGGKFAEGKPPGFAAIPTPSDLQRQIDELMQSPVLVDRNSTPAQRRAVTDKIMALRKQMEPKVETTV
jgi:hypothetical protein